MLKKNSWFNFLALACLLVGPKAAIADISNPQITFKPPVDDPKPDKTALGGRRTNDKQCVQDATNNPNRNSPIPTPKTRHQATHSPAPLQLHQSPLVYFFSLHRQQNPRARGAARHTRPQTQTAPHHLSGKR